MSDTLTRAAGLVLMALPLLGLMWLGATAPERPVKPPRRPAEPLSAGEWLSLPFALLTTLATLCWLAIAALVFLSPVLALAWLVAR